MVEGIMTIRLSGLPRWFLLSGCVGVLVALTLAAVGTSRIVSPSILLTLWPPSIFGIAEPTTPSDKIVLAIIEFGGNFVLYGVVGTLIGWGFRRRTA
jgi:hypothetical protein